LSKKFSEIKERILGPKYELSFSFVTPDKIKKLNNQYRNKNKPTDVLAFPLSKAEGEIVICKKEAAKKAKLFSRPASKYTTFLFIHACLHLKGMLHGSKMEKEEAKYEKLFRI
jgi:probable rRNA maturation factor